jgi:signal transduction histidine kinase
MPLTDHRRNALSRGRLLRRTVRFRLTLLYGSLFLVAGAALLAITYILVRSSGRFVVVSDSPKGVGHAKSLIRLTPNGTAEHVSGTRTPTPQELRVAQQLEAQAAATRASDLHHMLVYSGISLAIMAVLAIALGWLMAGRVLRPLRTMKRATEQISEHNLHERLSMEGPSDEIKNLADTIDDLFSRLETAFDAQRRFVANASHELQTPLTLERVLIEVGLANPTSTAEELRSVLRDVLESNAHQERLIEALLTLATSERGLDCWDPINLTVVTQDVLAARRADAERKSLRVDEALAPTRVVGNPDLIGRLIANLIDNAIRHNSPGGHVEIVTTAWEDHATLVVSNTGPIIRPDEIQRLFQPYQRLNRNRTAVADPDGHGLGLSIVQAIASAHGATVRARPRSGGGLEVQVNFPARGPTTKNARPHDRVHRLDLSERGREGDECRS